MYTKICNGTSSESVEVGAGVVVDRGFIDFDLVDGGFSDEA